MLSTSLLYPPLNFRFAQPYTFWTQQYGGRPHVVRLRSPTGLHDAVYIQPTERMVGFWPSRIEPEWEALNMASLPRTNLDSAKAAVQYVFNQNGPGEIREEQVKRPGQRVIQAFELVSPVQEKKLSEAVNEFIEDWQAAGYNLYRRNCRTFAASLMRKLHEWQQQSIRQGGFGMGNLHWRA